MRWLCYAIEGIFGVAVCVLLAGCHQRIRLGSPQFYRAPEICIIFVQGDRISDELAKAAIQACKQTSGEGEKK